MLHTRLRPHCKEFLEKIAKLYELHVFTFGSRLYAHTIAGNGLNYLHFSFFFFLFLSGLLVLSECVHKRELSAQSSFQLRGLEKDVSIKNMPRAGAIFNFSAFNTGVTFNLSISSLFLS